MKANFTEPSLTDHPTFDALYGLSWQQSSRDLMRGTVVVTDRVCQPFGIVHGGVFAAMGEALASIGTDLAVMEVGGIAMGMSNHTTFLRPIASGTVHAEAKLRHRADETWVWDVEITNDEGDLCAVGRIAIAVRPRAAFAQFRSP
jgi:1,4-dihydroxy-2-naphthoyl-CoA hydrolase